MWFTNTPIYNIFVMAIFGAIIGFILFIALFIWQKRIKKIFNKYENEQDDAIRMPLQKKFNVNKMLYKTFFILAFFTLLLSLGLTITFAICKHTALKYGAYGDFDRTESISSIHKRAQYGYIDQSEELPDDLSGYIIIFVKYGCPDCENVHDKLLACLKENNIDKVLFVSSRSEKGKALIDKYPIASVPSGVYFKLNQKEGELNRYTEVIYDEAPAPGQEDLFVEENMMKLIQYQKDGY